uniref:VP5 protein n=1 Tax=Spot-less plunderfish reovirus TaxID=3138863 RepID=A0AAU7LKG1_9REOV
MMLLVFPAPLADETPDYVLTYSTTLHEYIKKNPTIQILLFPWLRRQVDTALASHDVLTIVEALNSWDPFSSGFFILLPPWRRLAEELHSRKGSGEWDIPRETITKVMNGEKTTLRMSDFISETAPIVNKETGLHNMVKLVTSNKFVYTTTLDVMGGPIRRWGPERLYATFGTHVMRNVHKPTWEPQTIVRSGVYITPAPVTSVQNAVLLSSAHWPPSLQFGAIMDQIRTTYIMTGRVSTLSMLQMYLGMTKKSPILMEKSTEKARKMLRLPADKSTLTEEGGLLRRVHRSDLRVTLNSDPDASGKTRRQHISIYGALVNVLELHKVEMGTTYSIRLESGMLVEWFMLTLLLCLKLTGQNGRELKIDSAYGGPSPLTYAIITHMTPVRQVPYAPDQQARLNSYAIAMNKGSFKSTLISILERLLPDTRVFNPLAVIDSDDIGNKLSPTFENQLLNEWQKRGVRVMDKAALAIMGQPGGSLDELDVMYNIFIKLYKEVMTPFMRKELGDIVNNGITLVNAHCDSELLDANIPVDVNRCVIPMVTTSNIVIRPGRVGGTMMQLCLDYCYKCYAAESNYVPLGQILQPLLDPWFACILHPPDDYVWLSLGVEVPVTSLAAEDWLIEGLEPVRLEFCKLYVPRSRTEELLTTFPFQTRAHYAVTPHSTLDSRSPGEYEVNMTWWPKLSRLSFGLDVLCPVNSVAHTCFNGRLLRMGNHVVGNRSPFLWD